jgi:hypothetical protein
MNRLDIIKITALAAIFFNAFLAVMVLWRDYRSKLLGAWRWRSGTWECSI